MTIGPIACGLTDEYVAALRQAIAHESPDCEAPDHAKAADLVRWGFLAHDEHGEYRLTATGRAELDRHGTTSVADCPASA